MTSRLRQALRLVWRRRVRVLLAAAPLSAAIAAGGLAFSAVDAVVLRPLPFVDPAQLVDIKQVRRTSSSTGGATNSFASYDALRQSATVLRSVGAYAKVRPVWAQDGQPERVDAWLVSASFFRTLGSAPYLGRLFSDADDLVGASSKAVLSYGVWKDRFGEDPQVIGRTITLDEVETRVIGVMPPGFEYPRGSALWLSFGFRAVERSRSQQPHGPFWIVGRLRRGVTVQMARAQLDSLWRDLSTVNPAYSQWRCNIDSLQTYLEGSSRPLLYLVLLGAALLFGACCSNVGVMSAVQALSSRDDTRVRLALGARRLDLVFPIWVEATVVAAAAAGGALVLLLALTPAVPKVAAKQIPALQDMNLGMSVALVSVLLAVIGSLIIGCVQSLITARTAAIGGLEHARAGV